jgi:hypothetical protein
MNVIIGGQPAWRAQIDQHACPAVSITGADGVGSVMMGSPTVMINGMMACRMGDIVIEKPGLAMGPANPILMGCMTVIIGNGAAAGSAGFSSGMGSGGGSGAGTSTEEVSTHMGTAGSSQGETAASSASSGAGASFGGGGGGSSSAADAQQAACMTDAAAQGSPFVGTTDDSDDA